VNTCAAAAAHSSAIVRDTFQSVTVNGRTGGAVIEIIAHFNPAPNVLFNDNIIRILCGTGELKGIQAEGAVTSTQVTGGVNVRPFQLRGHFDPPGQANEFDFLCSGLPYPTRPGTMVVAFRPGSVSSWSSYPSPALDGGMRYPTASVARRPFIGCHTARGGRGG
jgi:hypothetical protein